MPSTKLYSNLIFQQLSGLLAKALNILPIQPEYRILIIWPNLGQHARKNTCSLFFYYLVSFWFWPKGLILCSLNCLPWNLGQFRIICYILRCVPTEQSAIIMMHPNPLIDVSQKKLCLMFGQGTQYREEDVKRTDKPTYTHSGTLRIDVRFILTMKFADKLSPLSLCFQFEE